MTEESLQHAYEAEREARIKAEKILEEKTREVNSNLELILSQYDELLLKNKELDLLMSVANFTQKQLSLTGALKQFIEILGETIRTPYILVYLLKKREKKLKLIDMTWTEKGFPEEFFKLIAKTEYGVGESIPGIVLASGKTLKWRGESNVAPGRASVIEQFGLDGCYAFPIKRYGEVIAVVEIGVRDWETFQKTVIDKVDSAVMQLSVALERRQSQKDTTHNLQRLEKTLCDLKNAQNKLIQTEKMASLGQLAAGVAHEINNPVSFILSNVETLEEYVSVFMNLTCQYQLMHDHIIQSQNYKSDAQLEEIIGEIDRIKDKEDVHFIVKDIIPMVNDSKGGLNRVREIVDNLKSFARADEDGRTLTNLNDCVKNTLKLVWNELKYNSRVETDLSDLPLLMCNAGQIEQVLMNLLINAGQACESNGVIVICTCVDDSDVLVRITDNGCGINKEIINKVFDPFYTTKPIGVGTGLGLSISYGIMEKHQGRIEVESETGKGTTFSLYLPATETVSDAMSSDT